MHSIFTTQWDFSRLLIESKLMGTTLLDPFLNNWSNSSYLFWYSDQSLWNKDRSHILPQKFWFLKTSLIFWDFLSWPNNWTWSKQSGLNWVWPFLKKNHESVTFGHLLWQSLLILLILQQVISDPIRRCYVTFYFHCPLNWTTFSIVKSETIHSSKVQFIHWICK